MSGKCKGAGQIPLVKGIPGGDCDSCSAWLLENIDKTEGPGAKLGDIAREQFAFLLDDCIRGLLELALPPREKDMTTKEWAGRILAKLHVSLEAHQSKLKREDPAYREGKTKWEKTRADVLVPKSEISQMVQEELINAEHYQFQLGILQEMINGQNEFRRVAVNKEAVFERVKQFDTSSLSRQRAKNKRHPDGLLAERSQKGRQKGDRGMARKEDAANRAFLR